MFKKSQQYFTNSKGKMHITNGKGKLKFALVSFCVSFFIVCSKLVLINRALLQKFFVYGKTYWATSSFGNYKLMGDDNKTKISELFLSFNNVVRDFLANFNWLILPLFAGLGMTALTWYIVYIDSCIPGIKPPTPFSPNNKNRQQRSPRFHMGYVVAIVNGFLVFLLMVFSWH